MKKLLLIYVMVRNFWRTISWKFVAFILRIYTTEVKTITLGSGVGTEIIFNTTYGDTKIIRICKGGLS